MEGFAPDGSRGNRPGSSEIAFCGCGKTASPVLRVQLTNDRTTATKENLFYGYKVCHTHELVIKVPLVVQNNHNQGPEHQVPFD